MGGMGIVFSQTTNCIVTKKGFLKIFFFVFHCHMSSEFAKEL